MRNLLFLECFLVFLTFSCKNVKEDPAKYAPAVHITIEPFADAFFAMDTNQVRSSIQQLNKTYPLFSEDFFTYILMTNPAKDTASIKAFYKAYMPIYKAAQKTNAIQVAKPALEEAFKRLHFYFPKYALPNKVVLFIGPLESYGNIVTKAATAVGLQMYLGANSDWYFSEQIQTIYPSYMSRRFAPEYIAVNSVQNILNDIEPMQLTGKNVLAQMIEEGKRQYIINKCFPATPDSIRMGYTQNQLNNLVQEESNIWTYLLKQNTLFSKDPSVVRSIIQEGAYSDMFGEEVPGNVGKYIGYKIVSAWMKQQDKVSFTDLLVASPDKIFEEAKYAP